MTNLLNKESVVDRSNDGATIKKEMLVFHLITVDVKETKIITPLKTHVNTIAKNPESVKVSFIYYSYKFDLVLEKITCVQLCPY